jgi:hypothetical protein
VKKGGLFSFNTFRDNFDDLYGDVYQKYLSEGVIELVEEVDY